MERVARKGIGSRTKARCSKGRVGIDWTAIIDRLCRWWCEQRFIPHCRANRKPAQPGVACGGQIAMYSVAFR